MKKWFVAAKRADFNRIAEKFKIDPVIARIIRNRDYITDDEIEQYLSDDLSLLHQPAALKDVEKAVEILCRKISEKKRIRIIGDYDVDGICSTYILYRALISCGAVVDTVIPHRIKDGYGINQEMIAQAVSDGIDTIITCDNGIAARDAFICAKEAGLSCIVTDHHEIPFVETEEGKQYILPEVDAVVNPKQKDCPYPFKEICGAYVAYQLSTVLFSRFEEIDEKEEILQELLECAGIATVCDVMPLRDENRILVKTALKSLKHSKNPGLRALLKVNEIDPEKASAYTIGFILGPCINATGRLDTADIALELLKEKNEENAILLATQLKELNASRKELTEQGVDKALKELEKEQFQSDRVLVLYLPGTHESIAGIIAGRIREITGKPVFILTDGEKDVKGSARSIETYNIYEEMVKCKDLFLKFGGHKMAAGLSLKKENIDKFRKRINDNCVLTEEDFTEKVLIDVPMPMSYVTKELIQELQLLEPFGNGNSKPVFAEKDLTVLSIRTMGKNGNMAKIRVADVKRNCFNLVMFRGAEKLIEEQPEKIDILYYPSINEYRGREELQFTVQDYQSK